MTPDVEVLPPDATLQHAAQTMQRLDVGVVPVCDGERLVGIVTDRDLVVRALAAGRGPDARVREAMTEGVTYCYDEDSVADAEATMKAKQIRRLLVLDRSKRLVGILSLGDLAVQAGHDARSGDTLQAISEPSRPTR